VTKSLIWLLLADLSWDTLKLLAAFAGAIFIALAFTIASLITLLAAAVPGAANGLNITAVQSTTNDPTGTLGVRIVALALSQLGVPYVWGGASPRSGFDCSGLTQWAYGEAGLALPRTAQGQFEATARVGAGELRPGDLVFFARTDPTSPDYVTHVGIYLGGGSMVNAPKEGEVVQTASAFTGYWGALFVGGGRR
jgi:cell wall-associated NlpC family hydrolase